MRGLQYQLKSVLHDKFCMMTFLLPIIVAAILHFVGSIDLSSLGEFHFGVIKGETSRQIVTWLERYGEVTVYETLEELTREVNETSTNLIGVKTDENGMRTIVAGDELDIFRQSADLLPTLYEQRQMASQIKIRILERPDILAGAQDMFIVITLIVAMFMGCTFNAMNIISEKEDGVAFINEILPMTSGQYVIQKLIIGFICGCISSIITACICFRLSLQNAALMLMLIVFSSFVAALIGLFIGKVSDGLMVGVVYIKVVMLLFMAVPIVSFLVGISNPFLSAVCYLVPSQATFEGIMGLWTGSRDAAVKDVFILLGHCMVWYMLYLVISKRKN